MTGQEIAPVMVEGVGLARAHALRVGGTGVGEALPQAWPCMQPLCLALLG